MDKSWKILDIQKQYISRKTPELSGYPGSVAEWLVCCTCDQRVTGSNLIAAALLSATMGKLFTYVPSLTKQY